MSTNSKIEWTERTWNPTTGCTKISPACINCYAEVMAKRLKAMKVKGYEKGFNLNIIPERLDAPLRRSKPTVYFVNSMSDLFHKDIPDSYIHRVLSIIEQSTQHTFQILTKRADRMHHYFKKHLAPKNVWLGVTVENRSHGLPRIEYLKRANATIRFLSVEPLLEDLGNINLTNIDWVIVGGESGPRSRPMKPEWAASIQQQCEEQSTLFFFKQWGGWGPDGIKRAKKNNGRLLNGRTWDDTPIIHSQQI